MTVVITGSCDMAALEDAVIDSHPSASVVPVLPAFCIRVVFLVGDAKIESGLGNVVSSAECCAGSIDGTVELRYFRTGPARPWCAQSKAITRCCSDGILM